MHPDGHISIHGGDGEIDINGSNIMIGKENGDYEFGVKYEQLRNILEEVKNGLNNAAEKCGGQPWCAVGTGLIQAANALNGLSKCQCTYTKVN